MSFPENISPTKVKRKDAPAEEEEGAAAQARHDRNHEEELEKFMSKQPKCSTDFISRNIDQINEWQDYQ